MRQTLTLPNILSYIRIALVPVFIVLFFNAPNLYYALSIYLIASLTDVADGFIARKYNLITKLGKVLDPLADKMLKLATLICFVVANAIPLWFLITMTIFDLSLIVAASILLNKNIVIKSNYVGKAGTAIISLGVLLTFFSKQLNNINLYVLYVGLFIVFCSCISYLLTYIKIKMHQ